MFDKVFKTMIKCTVMCRECPNAAFQAYIDLICFFVCISITSLLNICGHIASVPACSSDTLTNVLPHRNVIPQTQGM